MDVIERIKSELSSRWTIQAGSKLAKTSET